MRLDRSTLLRAWRGGARRLRWLVSPPPVPSPATRPFPGAAAIDEEEERAAVEAVREVIRSKRLFRHYGASARPFESSRVARFESRFARVLGSRHAVAMNSGTSALECGLAALGVGPGDEVIVPAYTWFSTAGAVLSVGAVPILAEVDESLTLDVGDVRDKLSPHTRAVVPVHVRGAPAAMDALVELARERSLALLEDVAQAAGGTHRGRALGTIGDAGAFSFQMSKMLTAGEGGALVTDDREIFRRAAMAHDAAAVPHYGISLDDWLPGGNRRMSELHAAVLLVQLERLAELRAGLRARKRRLEDLVRGDLERCGVRLRRLHDPDGEIGIALVFFVPEAAAAARVTKALADDNVPASRLYLELAELPGDYVDLHVATAWSPLLAKRAWHPEGSPWRRHPRPIDYGRDPCPRTLDLLRRAVHVDVHGDAPLDVIERQAEAIVRAVRSRL